MALTLSRITLAALCGTGVWALAFFSRNNGTFPAMERFQAKNLLPDGYTTYTPSFTTIKPVDDVFFFVLTFFWPMIDGSRPALSLLSFAFGGQAIAVWTITMLEGLRSGNAWKAISFTGAYGMACQILGMGVAAPLFLLIHTFLSPLAAKPTARGISTTSTASIAAIPASLTLGFIVPSILMALPAPDLLPVDTKVLVHNIWQIFPITCSLLQIILSTIWPYNSPATPQNTIKHLRLVYKFALTFAAPAHLAAVSITTAAALFPTLFSPTHVGHLHPMNVFVPPASTFDTSTRITELSQGVMWFIQWDNALAGTSYLVWALVLRGQARRFVGDKETMGIQGFLKVAVRVLTLGPGGAALAYVWERDELVLATVPAVERKKIQ